MYSSKAISIIKEGTSYRACIRSQRVDNLVGNTIRYR